MASSTEGNVFQEVISSNQRYSSNIKQKTMETIPWKDVDPIVVSEEEYLEIFGSSSDEETEFYGFSEKELGLKEFRNVFSPNKFQDDFYMPLFLSHRKRNRDHVQEKPQECHQDTKKTVEAKASVSTSKQAKHVVESPQKPFHFVSKFEHENPYAKQYKSYRRERTKSVPLPFEKDKERRKDDNSVIEKVVKTDIPAKEELDDVQTTSIEKPNLKMKIQYQSHVRPKRKVIVQESDDYVYGITLPSKKRARTLSPTVITNVKILKADKEINNSELLGKGGVIDNESLDIVKDQRETTCKESFMVPLADLSKQILEETVEPQDKTSKSQIQNDNTSFDVRSKRKRRFKNFRGRETEYLKAVCGDVISLKNELQDKADISSENSSGESVKNDSVIEVGNSDVSVTGVDAGTSLDVSKDNLNKDIESLSKQLKMTGGAHGAENIKEECNTNQVNEASLAGEIDRETSTDTKAKKITPETKESGQNKSKLPKVKHEMEDSSRASVVTEKKKDGGKENKKSSKDINTRNAAARELRRKEKPCTSFKPKDINLTDSWFIVSNKPTRRSSNLDKSKSACKTTNESTDSKGIRRNSNSNIDNEEVQQIKAPSIGKFLPAGNRKSVTRRRRIKNVSGDGYFNDGTSKRNEELERDSQIGSTDRENNKSQEDSRNNIKKSVNTDDDKNIFSHLSDSNNEEYSEVPGRKLETNGMSQVAVQVTRLDSLISEENSSTECTDKSIPIASDKELNTSSSDIKRNVLDPPDHGFRTKADGISRCYDESRSVSSGIENVNAGQHGTVSERSHLTFGDEEAKSDAKPVVEAVSSKRQTRNESRESLSTIKVTFSTPVEMIEGSSSKNTEKSHVIGRGEEEAHSASNEGLLSDSRSNVPQARRFSDAKTRFAPERNSCKDGQDLKERGIVDLTKIGRKINRRFSKTNNKTVKNVKSGKSFIIKTPVDDSEKQVTVKPSKPTTRRNSKGVEENESDTDIDITVLDKDNVVEKEDDYKDTKVKRKIYTVVRKIRRTEISADGKKVTKIIKQIVKKVCPITNDVPGSNDSDVKRNATTEKQIKSGDDLPEKTGENKTDGSDDRRVKSAWNRKCGKCDGCLRREDCKQCEACRFV